MSVPGQVLLWLWPEGRGPGRTRQPSESSALEPWEKQGPPVPVLTFRPRPGTPTRLLQPGLRVDAPLAPEQPGAVGGLLPSRHECGGMQSVLVCTRDFSRDFQTDIPPLIQTNDGEAYATVVGSPVSLRCDFFASPQAVVSW